MSSLVSWTVYDNSNVPVTGLSPTLLAYCTLAGVTRPIVPVPQELPGGSYGFEASEEDEEAGTAYLIDNGPNTSPRYISGVCTTPTLPKSVWHLEDDDGDLWTGAPPTINSGSYASLAGPRTAPSVQVPRTYLFGVTPTADDAAIGVNFLATSPAGANPPAWQDTLVAAGVDPAPPVDSYVQHAIMVGNVIELLGLGFTHIEVHQSIDQGNSYQEVTAASATSARLNSSVASTTFQMGGRALRLKVDGEDEVNITFSSVLPQWTPLQVVNRINEIVPGLAYVSGSAVWLASSITGRTSSIEITYNDAEDLGWEAGQVVYGTMARLPLSTGTLLYQFSDVAGRIDDRYKWRFSANGANPISNFSEVFQGEMSPLLPSANLSVALARFYGADGQPKKTRVLIAIDSIPQNIGGTFIGGPGPLLSVDSDDLGFFQTTLVRGARVKVAIENSSFAREFVVPDAASFQLLDAMTAVPDPFTVQTVPPLLIRRSS